MPDSVFFWPGMGAQLQNRRQQCRRCNETAPSHRKEPSYEPIHTEYPFQKAVTDIFHMAGRKYIIYTDRFSGWTEVASAHPDMKAGTICNILRRYFICFGVPEEITSDGGPPFSSHEMSMFLKTWGVKHRTSSAYYPQSNGRAEAAVKHMKRILTTNISPSGSLDTDAVAKALLLHRNTPASDIGVSPAELLFGRPLNDHLPAPVVFRKEWLELANLRENAINKRHLHATKSDSNAPPLRELKPGDPVSVQNQHGNQPLRWNNTGVILEALPHRQYRILIDGSRRTTLRNRKYIRHIQHSTRDRTFDITQPPPLTPLLSDTTAALKPISHIMSPPKYPSPPKHLRTSPQSTNHVQPMLADNNDDPPSPPLNMDHDISRSEPPLMEQNDNRILIHNRPQRVRRMPTRYSDYIVG